MTRLDPMACGMTLIVTFALAGLAQTMWFAWPASGRFAIPLDGALTWRGRRLLGDHKTLRGFVVMIPAAALTMPFVAAASFRLGHAAIWPLSPVAYMAFGAWCAAGFMLGELPNSFLKRQIGVPPGASPPGHLGAWLMTLDRLDSTIGLLLAASLVVEVPRLTCLLVLVVGPFLHWLFSVALFALGLKARPA